MADVDLKVRIDPNIEGEDALNALVTKLQGYADKPYTIKVKVEAVDGQKGLNNLINGLDKSAKNFSKKTLTSAKSANTEVKAVTESMLEAEKVRKNASKQLKKDNSEAAKSYKAVIDKELQNQKIWQNMNKAGGLSDKQLQQYMDESSKKIIEADKNYQSFIKTRDEQIRQDKNAIAANKLVEKTEAQRNKQIEQRGNLIEKEKAAQEKAWDSRKATIEKQEDKWNKQLEQAGKPYEKELKEYDRLNSKVSEDSKARWNAQRQVMSDEARLSKEINSWTAARHGKTSNDYKDLINSREEMARLHNELERGEITWKDYEEGYRSAVSAASKAENNIIKEGKNTLSFGDKVKSAFSELSRYITPAMVLREGIQAVKQMAQASMEIESAMTRIQIVTGSTDSQMTQFFDTASNQAQELGKNITDVAGSIETFSRLGFNLSEAENLSKFATIMSNVADTSIDEATTGLTSIIKGFGLEAKDAEHVSDVLIDVGQKYAISASELMQSFERGGAALHASGASFEESAALFAATNAALQNASTTGTMWKTVSARLRGATSELKEMGEETDGLAQGLSKYRDELIQLSGVDIMKNANEYKNPYQIFTELAENWDKINGDPAKARVAEILGGTRQLSGIMSTITNIKDAMGAYETATNSAGVAMEANDKYMETTAAHVGQLKASFQELSYDMLNGDLMKGFVDFGKGSLNVIDGVVDRVGTMGTALLGISSAILPRIAKQLKNLGAFGGSFSNFKDGVSELGLGSKIAGGIGVVSLGLTAAAAAYEQYQKVQRQQNQEANEAADTFNERAKALTDYADRVHELRTQLAQGELSESEALGAKKELLEIQNQLNESYQSGAENLSLLTGQVDEQVKAIRDLNYENAINFMTRQGGENGGIEDAIAAMEGGVGEKIPFHAEHSDAYLGTFSGYAEEGKKVLELAESYGELFDIIRPYGTDGEINLYFRGNAEEAQTTLRDFTKDVRALADVGESDIIDNVFNQSTQALNNADEILSTYKNIYDTYKQTQLITDDKDYRWLPKNGEADTRKAIDWINDYRKAVEEYNDALLSGDTEKIAEAKSSFEYIDNALTGLVGLGGKFSNYAEMIQEIRDQVQESLVETNKLQDTLDNSMMSPYVDNVKDLNITQDAFRNFLLDYKNGLLDQSNLTEEAQTTLKGFISALGEMGIAAFDASGNINEELVSALINLNAFTLQNIESTEQAASTLESFSEYQSTLSSAINSSRSATGLSTEEIEKLTAAYEDLESFDPEKLFENTLNGIHLNNEELKRLNAEIEQSKLTDLAKQLADQYDQYKDLRSQGADTSAIEAEIAATQQLMAQYEGLASAYNAWINAKSGSKERDTYEGIGSGFSEMEKIKNAGWYGDPALNAWLDLVLNPSARTGDAEADWARLGQTIADTGHSILDYWQYDANGNLVSDGLFMFLDDVNQVFGDAYSTVRDGYNVWDFTGNKLQEVSDMFGLSTEAIQSFERALVDTGGAVIFDNSNLDIMTGSLKNLNQKTGILDSAGISLDFDISEMSAGELQAKIDELDGLTAEIDVEADGGEDALAMMEALQYLLDQEYYLKLNTETGGGLDSAAQKIERVNQLIAEANSQGINVHTFVEGSTEVQQIAADIAALPTDVQIAIGVTEENLNDPAGIASQFADNSINIPVNYTVHADPEAEYADQNPQVTYGIDAPAAPTYPDQNPSVNYKVNAAPAPNYPNLQRSVTYSVHTVGGGRITKASGTMTSVARADGSMVNAPWNWKHAYADGKVALDQDELALVNELGTESIIRDGQWMLLPGGMHQEALRKGDIILSAAQTKALIQTGKASGHGHAYANGSILSSAYTLGSTAQRRTNGGSTTSLGGKSSPGSSGSKSKSSGGNNNGNKESNSEDDEPEIFDWIELAIDRIERAIKQLGITAKSTFKTLTTRLEANATEIKTVTDEIELQQKAYDRYIQQADSVGLSDELAERVRNGAIDINEYDKETQELINKYKEWYEKALDCDDAIQKLHEDLGQLYEDRFTDTKDDFDAQLDMLEHMTNTFENGMDDIEARGYLMTTKYYEAMRDVERQNIDVMNKELDALTEKMSQAVNSGEIKEGSQAWYDMQRDINDVKEAIQEAETSVIEFGNSIRETLWDRFDYLQDRITEITDEAEFMIDLMDFSKLYDDQGQLTNTGMATMGLHGMNYNVMMNQADRYAAEIKKINKELANDPYNTKLLEQRQEWIESQRESILNAEEEKQAIVDMVEEGIRLELDALNEVINKYKESLDTAKSLADYQKKVKEQSDNISTIQKRISAYAGDNSEESRSTIQKLNTDLTKAIETLQDTQENRRISETKEMLSNLYDQYEMTLNQRLDDVDALISDMISTINSNAGNIDTTIKNEAKDVGYTLSEAMRNIWTTDGKVSSVITLYGDNFVKFGENFNGALTTVNEVILRIAEYVAKMAGASDKEAKARIKETTPTTKTNKAAKPVTPPAPKKVNKPAEKKQDAHTDQEKYGVAIAIWNGLQGWGGGQDRKNKLESKGFNYDEIQGIVNKIRGDILSNSWSGKYYGITGADIPKYAYNKFKSGGIVDYTGLAQVDGTPGRPESFLNAKDTYNFTVLKDLLDKAIHGGNHGIDLFAGITGISKPNGIKNSMFGDITYQINIPIDHVENYDDFVNKMRSDGKFEKLIQSMTIDQMAGRGSLSKNKYKW